MKSNALPPHEDQDLRFAFGRNWKSFLSTLDERRINEAQRRLCESLGHDQLRGMRVLDIGSGSGLSSLVMHQLGADVVAFDYDVDSVACTEELRRRYAPNATNWQIMQGSALDPTFMAGLGQFDLVYSWGVLHHTGAMWPAIDLAATRVAPHGTLLLALYNDQGRRSRIWHTIKRIYCSSTLGCWLVGATFYPLFATYALWQDLRHFHMPGSHARNYARKRGMSLFHDWRDWLGGYPFEVAKPEEVVRKLAAAGFELQSQTLTQGLGCNEFVFAKSALSHDK
ncbi:class I SAM-dependent methyltransferase [Dyella sp. EPa41]|uniref:class I SAM-dependent methyltransferase n=1 Tax=Dyella sp. EPa41 TaxID=1561194 RepID=UPI001915FCC8|nr:class I SAM-dependent methyltransferase [Dyella sp. EPa41]